MEWIRGTLGVWMALVLGLAGTLSFPAPAVADIDVDAESRLEQMIEAERIGRGLGSLMPHPELVEAARLQAQRMADEGRLFHNPDLASVADGWSLLGENVASSYSVESAHDALMRSTSHRENVLHPEFTHVGVAVVADADRLWIVEVFMASDHVPPFVDDDGSVHEGSIVSLASAGITKGCGEGRFCPDDPVTRGQMASFLVRALGLAPAGGDVFSDDDGSVHEASIQALAAAGITKGCAEGRYCPDEPVTRGQMATFLERALGG